MKQDDESKFNVKLRIGLLLVCIVLISTFFVGCTSSREEGKVNPKPEETLETMEEPLRIFYDGTGEYLLRSFINAHSEMDIRLINCIPGVDKAIDFGSIIAKYGVPDLIVAREEVSVYLSEWYAEGYIADLGEFCAYDLSINEDDYFPETFEVFRENDNMYALPLGIAMDLMMIAESKYENSDLVKLEEEYTGRELLNILLEEVQKEKEPGEFFSEEGISSLLLMHYLDVVTQTEDGIHMDEELFKLVYEFGYKNGKISDEATEFWKQQGKDFSSQSGYIPRNAFDPRRYEGNFTASIRSLGEAPTQVLSYAETAYQYFSEEGIKAIYFPTADDGSKYQARVKLWGAVARESSRKELAFELLRQLMDEDIDSFGAPWGIGEIPPGAGILNVNVYPVNIENAVSFLDRFENQSAKLMYGTQNATILDRADISEVEKEKHAEMLSSISGLFCWNKELEKIDSIFDDYYTANITDYENCYIDMLNSLNAVALTEKTLDFNDNVQENGENSNVIEKEYEVSDEAKVLKEKIRNTKIGETFFFGETEQDNDFDNGAEPIEWIVLEKKEDKAFVISKKIIEWLTFSKYDNMVVTDEGVRGEKDYFTWDIERNQQRIWLTNDLYENGFSEIEKEIILLTHIKTDGSSYEYDDYLYIPSEDDVETYLTDIQLRQAEMTVYVAKKANQFEGEFGCWSLRSKLMLTEWKYTVQIKENGEFGGMYTFVPNGVRPVMWLDIS